MNDQLSSPQDLLEAFVQWYRRQRHQNRHGFQQFNLPTHDGCCQKISLRHRRRTRRVRSPQRSKKITKSVCARACRPVGRGGQLSASTLQAYDEARCHLPRYWRSAEADAVRPDRPRRLTPTCRRILAMMRDQPAGLTMVVVTGIGFAHRPPTASSSPDSGHIAQRWYARKLISKSAVAHPQAFLSRPVFSRTSSFDGLPNRRRSRRRCSSIWMDFMLRQQSGFAGNITSASEAGRQEIRQYPCYPGIVHGRSRQRGSEQQTSLQSMASKQCSAMLRGRAIVAPPGRWIRQKSIGIRADMDACQSGRTGLSL